MQTSVAQSAIELSEQSGASKGFFRKPPAPVTVPSVSSSRPVIRNTGSLSSQRLMSVPGVGPLISTAVVAAVGSGEAFERGRDFGAWLGLVPRQYSTGGRSILGGISKRGSKYLRTLFIQAAKVILMRPHNWEKFSFGAWLQNAAPRMHANKLAVALANELARIAWSVLRNETTFDRHVTTKI